MGIGADRPNGAEEPKKRGLFFWLVLAAGSFFIVVPSLLFVAYEIHRQVETPQERATEDREEARLDQERARRDQAEKAQKDAGDLENDRWAWAEAQKAYVKVNVLARLKDPGSAYFGRVFVRVPDKFDKKANGIVCGSVNAKNSFGGYTGMQGFVTFQNSLYIKPEARYFTYWNRYCVKGQFL